MGLFDGLEQLYKYATGQPAHAGTVADPVPGQVFDADGNPMTYSGGDIIAGDDGTVSTVRDTFTLDGVDYYTDTGEQVTYLGPPKPDPAQTIAAKAREALGLSKNSDDPLGLQQVKDILFYASITGGVVLVLYVAVQIKIALR